MNNRDLIDAWLAFECQPFSINDEDKIVVFFDSVVDLLEEYGIDLSVARQLLNKLSTRE